mmetsp:Transcript_24996/g.58654  ORF Transcript_24996/g.58654 Transcript_24996/m.58654 type:complete len:282 (+) Transcript_24996:1001-1846(+)
MNEHHDFVLARLKDSVFDVVVHDVDHFTPRRNEPQTVRVRFQIPLRFSPGEDGPHRQIGQPRHALVLGPDELFLLHEVLLFAFSDLLGSGALSELGYLTKGGHQVVPVQATERHFAYERGVRGVLLDEFRHVRRCVLSERDSRRVEVDAQERGVVRIRKNDVLDGADVEGNRVSEDRKKHALVCHVHFHLIRLHVGRIVAGGSIRFQFLGHVLFDLSPLFGILTGDFPHALFVAPLHELDLPAFTVRDAFRDFRDFARIPRQSLGSPIPVRVGRLRGQFSC